MPYLPFSVVHRTKVFGSGYMKSNTQQTQNFYTECNATIGNNTDDIKPMNNTYPCYGCGGAAGRKCYTKNSQTMLEIFNRRNYNYVRVPSSLYMMEKSAFNVYSDSRVKATTQKPAGTWNQSSDRNEKHIGTAVVPSHGNSTKRSLTRHRPGASGPGGAGVDIKHNSYARYLNRIKGKEIIAGPYVGDLVKANATVDNKVQKSSISFFCKNYQCK